MRLSQAGELQAAFRIVSDACESPHGNKQTQSYYFCAFKQTIAGLGRTLLVLHEVPRVRGKKYGSSAAFEERSERFNESAHAIERVLHI